MSPRTILPLLLAIGLSACRTAPKDDNGTTVAYDGVSDATEDDDGDGFSGADDCDDQNASVHAGAEEVCDGIDNNCDGVVDEGVLLDWYADTDGDGFGDPDALNQACEPGAGETPNASDCDDTDPEVFPGAVELCDGIDNNCDGVADEGGEVTTYADTDGDGFGDPGTALEECGSTPGRVVDDSDCDDTNPDIHPDADEQCNDVDDNCNGDVDEGIDAIWYLDSDGDGWGAVDQTASDCEAPSGYTANAGDCDDTDAAVSPGGTEVCNSIDDDCDGTIDGPTATDASPWYIDGDGDGYGDPASVVSACAQPSGTVADGADCDDALATVNPGASEVCNTIDDDCDGAVDDADPSLDTSTGSAWYADADGDSYGDSSATTLACSQPAGTVSDTSDCDDTSASVNPAAAEVCNSIDDDCDGAIDDDDDSLDTTTGSTFYTDADGDAYGDPSTGTAACVAPAGSVSDSSDCDDTAAAVNPSALEICNAIDDDCDGTIDDDDPSVDTSTATSWYDDDDGDGYGDASAATTACSAPTGTVADATDCDDTAAAVSPGASEVCNSIDDDCDGAVDDADTSLDTSTGTAFYDDADGDTYGDAGSVVRACTQPTGTVTDATDCDDTAVTVFPGATELCNLTDDDCDGTIDDGVMGSAAACPAESCLDILVDQPSSSSGTYSIDFDGTATDTTCDMTTDGGGWTLMFADDFESTPDAGWSTSATYACGAWSTLLGGYGNTAGTEIDIIVDLYAVPHTEAWVELEYIALDSWDGELAYVSADGTTLFSQSQDNHSTAYAEVCGWNRSFEGSYDSTWTIDDTLSHTDDDLELIAGSTLNQDPYDESFGVDDVMVWVR